MGDLVPLLGRPRFHAPVRIGSDHRAPQPNRPSKRITAAKPRTAAIKGTRKPTTARPRIAVLGSQNAFTEQAVRRLCMSEIPPAALMVDTDAAPGPRGSIPIALRAPITRLAADYGFTLIHARDPNDPSAIAALEPLQPDLLLLACLPQIAGRAVRRIARLGALNLHPSGLPRFRGPDPIFWQLRAGLARVGVTIHIAADVVDAGPIVIQRWCGVAPGISANALTTALVGSGIDALVRVLPEIEDRIDTATRQNESAATHQPRPRAEDFRLDTSWTAERAYRFIEGVRGSSTFTITDDAGAVEVERAVAFDPKARPERAIERAGGIVTIRFAEGALRAVPVRRSRFGEPARAALERE